MKKRINSRVKGRNAELAWKKLMESAGWTVLLVKPPKKYDKENDFFNLYDGIAYKGKYRKYVQIKCNRMIGKRDRLKYIEWGNRFGNEYETVEIWVKYDNKPVSERWHAHILWNEGGE